MSKITKPTTAKPSSPHPKLYLKLRCIQAGLRDWELEQAAKKAATDETALQASKERTEPKLYLKLRCIQAGLRDWEEAQAANVAALEELDVSKLRTASKVVAEKASTISKKDKGAAKRASTTSPRRVTRTSMRNGSCRKNAGVTRESLSEWCLKVPRMRIM